MLGDSERGPNEVQNVSNSSPCSKVQSWRSFQIRQPAGVSDWKVLFLVSVLGLYLFLCSLCSWRLLLYSSTPLLLYSSTPLLLCSSTPLLLYSSAPLLLYSSAPLLLYSSTPLLLCSSAPLLLYSSTPLPFFEYSTSQASKAAVKIGKESLVIWLFGTTGHHSVMYKFHYYKAKTPKTQGNSYNHLHGIHEKLTVNHQLETTQTC